MKMNNEKSFLLYTAYAEQLDEMTDAQAGQLFRAILEYESDGKPVISDPMVKLAFSFIASQLRRDDEKWEETRKQRSEAGKKSARLRAKNSAPSNEESEEEPEAVEDKSPAQQIPDKFNNVQPCSTKPDTEEQIPTETDTEEQDPTETDETQPCSTEPTVNVDVDVDEDVDDNVYVDVDEYEDVDVNVDADETDDGTDERRSAPEASPSVVGTDCQTSAEKVIIFDGFDEKQSAELIALCGEDNARMYTQKINGWQKQTGKTCRDPVGWIRRWWAEDKPKLMPKRQAPSYDLDAFEQYARNYQFDPKRKASD